MVHLTLDHQSINLSCYKSPMSFGAASLEGFVMHLLYYKSSFLSISELTVGEGWGEWGYVCMCVTDTHLHLRYWLGGKFNEYLAYSKPEL